MIHFLERLDKLDIYRDTIEDVWEAIEEVAASHDSGLVDIDRVAETAEVEPDTAQTVVMAFFADGHLTGTYRARDPDTEEQIASEQDTMPELEEAIEANGYEVEDVEIMVRFWKKGDTLIHFSLLPEREQEQCGKPN